MLLKIALIDDNESYRSRLLAAVAEDYTDRIEMTSFSSLETFEEYVQNATVDVMLVSEHLAEEHLAGRRGATLVYLVDDKSVDQMYGKPAVCRYQKVDLIYRGILNACSDRFDRFSSRTAALEGTSIITFLPASGGAGASTMAAACALGAARRNLRAFYLNLELYGSAEQYFDAPGESGLDDVLFAIEAKRPGVAMRVRGATRKTSDGVRFITSCSNATDIEELSAEHLTQLVNEIAASDSYDVIVIDMDYAHSDLALAAMGLSRQTVFVSNGTPVSNHKFERIYQHLQAKSRAGSIAGLGGIALAYNNFSSKTGRRVTADLVPVLGGLNRVVAESNAQIVDALASNQFFDNLFDGEV